MSDRWMIMMMVAGSVACATRSPSGASQPGASQPMAQQEPAAQPEQSTDERVLVAGTDEEGMIEPEADAALRRMSEYLGELQGFRVDVTSTDELVTKEGQKIQFVKETKVAVRRPNKLLAERIGPAGRVVLRYDGQQISVHGTDLGIYAVESAPVDLKAMIDHARDSLHIDAPAGDLLLPDTYEELIDGVRLGRYIGREQIGGVYAHHLAMNEEVVDWQIWIKDGPDAVPLRYVITTKDVTGQPQFTAELHDWRLDTSLANAQFVFKRPARGRRLSFKELQEMKAEATKPIKAVNEREGT